MKNYLVVCPSLERAAAMQNRLLGYLVKVEIRCRSYRHSSRILIDILGTHQTIRFTSDRRYYEDSKGFDGWIVEEKQVDDWLDAAEGMENG